MGGVRVLGVTRAAPEGSILDSLQLLDVSLAGRRCPRRARVLHRGLDVLLVGVAEEFLLLTPGCVLMSLRLFFAFASVRFTCSVNLSFESYISPSILGFLFVSRVSPPIFKLVIKKQRG